MITQEDREAAKRYDGPLWGWKRGSVEMIDDLAMDFARHRETAYEAGRLAGMEQAAVIADTTFKLGDRVTKIKGSAWTGRVVGFYRTALTPEGYAIESENEPGSVQIYPVTAIRAAKEGS